MNKRNLLVGGSIAVLSICLIALPSPSATRNSQQDEARLEEKLQKVQTQVDIATAKALRKSAQALQRVQEEMDALPEVQDYAVLLGDEGASWLGVETREVSSDFAKEHKLSAERGVVVGKVISDSPAAKAGLKESDVVTEINGQRIEGTAQFRRMIREIPAGRAVQLNLWRDGRQQTVSVTLGKAEDRRRSLKMDTPAPGAPGSFAFTMPEIPMVPPM